MHLPTRYATKITAASVSLLAAFAFSFSVRSQEPTNQEKPQTPAPAASPTPAPKETPATKETKDPANKTAAPKHASTSRHRVRYAIGGSERYRVKRSTNSDREIPTSSASAAIVHGYATRLFTSSNASGRRACRRRTFRW